MINVTKTYLPDKNKFYSYTDKIFESGWVTNNGQFCKEINERLSDYLGVKNLLLVSNGTLALQLAYKLLNLSGDVLTTPFSFVATTSSLVWEGLNPIFVDIDSKTFNLDSNQIEKKITPNTTAIVATHVYGNACDLERIQSIADKYNLKVIYDAAHAFGVNYKNNSILNFGDISAISFHGTKIFHTIEGGALVIKDDALYERAQKMINFGIVSPTEIAELGINSKMNEFQAAMGICVLDDIHLILNSRKIRYDKYMKAFSNSESLIFQKKNEHSTMNYSHFPVVFESEEIVLKVIEELGKNGIVPRRYFYPSLNNLPYLTNKQIAPNSTDISSRILCLPLFDSLEEEAQDFIIQIVRKHSKLLRKQIIL
ncbi:DegT/DnrJ/EryC1/StrS family aminotransferase [Paenibacillus alba]|uniref:DegT/DnrJ/EryC1/StrS family aminotransferase n=1 Tax=Paenibacillus alba TaxID=1197127 RepID=A0ABU6GG58_9BACL|nr:DegT/DnrJ/EryC1/StrS family aminotransferase [Paenibacillus alba]MEC0232690.1 DegT/DnrJ/EryC1/StrS family aminotransferase [Paenibacillus alba]